MPTRYRRLAKELSLAKDPEEIIKLTAQLVMDVQEQVKRTPGLEGVYPDVSIRWHLGQEHDDLYRQLVLSPFGEEITGNGRKYRWKEWYRTTVFR